MGTYMENAKQIKLNSYRDEHFFDKRTENIIFIIVITAIAMYMRYLLFPFQSGDFNTFLQPWMNAIIEMGPFNALGTRIGDYTPPYFYILSLLTFLPLSALTAIKAVSCVADIVLAFYVMRIVNLKYKDKGYGLIAYATVLFCPTVFLNSACWAQCDAIFTSALIACLYYVLKGKDVKAMIAFSVSFIFKIQAIFFLPFIAVMILKKRIRWRTLLLVPLIYFISIIPSLLAGRPLFDLLTIYFDQAAQYPRLALYFPNLYSWIPDDYAEYLGKPAVLFALAVTLISLAAIYRKKFKLNDDIIITVALFYALMLPFVLPHMHERYYYLADIVSIVFAFWIPKKIYVSLITVGASLLSICRYLFYVQFFSFEELAIVVAINLIIVTITLVKQLRKSGDDLDKEELLAKLKSSETAVLETK